LSDDVFQACSGLGVVGFDYHRIFVDHLVFNDCRLFRLDPCYAFSDCDELLFQKSMALAAH
jgi:hypothetical protein